MNQINRVVVVVFVVVVVVVLVVVVLVMRVCDSPYFTISLFTS